MTTRRHRPRRCMPPRGPGATTTPTRRREPSSTPSSPRRAEGDEAAAADLADRMPGLLEFGTAGLRGALGAGPNRMNRSVVIRAAAGLTGIPPGRGRRRAPTVVVGYDARYNSDVFARDTAAVLVAAGGRGAAAPPARCRRRSSPSPSATSAPTPASMVTASHNPPQDNGYKVYLGDGSQIVPPADAEIAAHIAAVERVADVPRAADGWETLGDDLARGLRRRRRQRRRPRRSPRDLRIVHTSLHGVGHGTVHTAFVQAGFAGPGRRRRAGRARPGLPDRRLPQPRGEGRDRPRARPRPRASARDLVIANDPDADRCAAAVLDPALGDWRMLRGDEVGALLGAHLVRRGVARATSSPTRSCPRACSRRSPRRPDSRHEETLTGFKWISRVDRACATATRRPSATASPRARPRQGRRQRRPRCSPSSPPAQGRGAHPHRPARRPRESSTACTRPTRSRCASSDLAQTDTLMARLRAEPPTTVAGVEVTRTDDLAAGDGGLPPDRGPALPPRRPLAGHRPPERHRAQGQGLPRGHRARRDGSDARGVPRGGRDPSRPRPGRPRSPDVPLTGATAYALSRRRARVGEVRRRRSR